MSERRADAGTVVWCVVTRRATDQLLVIFHTNILAPMGRVRATTGAYQVWQTGGGPPG